VIEFLLQVLGNEESDKVQALICTGFAKLMLSGMISDERVRALFKSYLILPCEPDNGPAGTDQSSVDLPLA
jgi:condensin complex subunit 3